MFAYDVATIHICYDGILDVLVLLFDVLQGDLRYIGAGAASMLPPGGSAVVLGPGGARLVASAGSAAGEPVHVRVTRLTLFQ